MKLISILTLSVILFCINGIEGTNLTCYQCKKTVDEECLPQDLLPCPSSSDRCVTYITNSVQNGFSIKRECGLGPCGFNDIMVTKKLGLDITCDRSLKEYSCLQCCRESGCNKSGSNYITSSKIMLYIAVLIVCLLNITGDFLPPYFNSDKFKK